MSSDSIHIFVLIDALGWTYAEEADFLGDYLPYRAPLRTVLGFSSGAIPSILTGLMPARHGKWNLFYYDPENSPFRWLRHFAFLPDRLLENRYTRKLLKEAGRRVLGLGSTFECCVSTRLLRWFNVSETRNIYAPGSIPGSRSIFDDLQAAGVPHRIYSYHQGTDLELLRRAQRDVEASSGRFYFIYLSELDAFLHHHCDDPDAVQSRVRWYESQVRELFAAARKTCPDASLCVFSDHGMTPVDAMVDLSQEVSRLGYTMPDDYLAVFDATMARFWFSSAAARRDICSLLDDLPCGTLLSDDERESLGILFPDRRYGETVFLLRPGCLISSSGFHLRNHLPHGMHGYHPSDRYSDAAFLCDRAPGSPLHAIPELYGYMKAAIR